MLKSENKPEGQQNKSFKPETETLKTHILYIFWNVKKNARSRRTSVIGNGVFHYCLKWTDYWRQENALTADRCVVEPTDYIPLRRTSHHHHLLDAFTFRHPYILLSSLRSPTVDSPTIKTTKQKGTQQIKNDKSELKSCTMRHLLHALRRGRESKHRLVVFFEDA